MAITEYVIRLKTLTTTLYTVIITAETLIVYWKTTATHSLLSYRNWSRLLFHYDNLLPSRHDDVDSILIDAICWLIIYICLSYILLQIRLWNNLRIHVWIIYLKNLPILGLSNLILNRIRNLSWILITLLNKFNLFFPSHLHPLMIIHNCLFFETDTN